MGTEAIYEPVHLGVAWTSPVDVEERMLLTRRGIKLVWSQEGALGRQSFGALMVSVFFFLVFFPRPFFSSFSSSSFSSSSFFYPRLLIYRMSVRRVFIMQGSRT